MSELRTRMLRDMTVRGFARRTQQAYIAAVVRMAKYYRRPPDQLTNDEVQNYLAHLHERKLSWSTCSQAAHAFRFLYHVPSAIRVSPFASPRPSNRRSSRTSSVARTSGAYSARAPTPVTAWCSRPCTPPGFASARRSRSRCRTSTRIA